MHNHALAEYLKGHSYAVRLSESEASVVVELSKCHIHPRDILTLLKQNNPTNVSTMKNIYNARHKYRVLEPGGQRS